MSNLGTVKADPTTGKYEPRHDNSGFARILDDNEDAPNGAYDEPVRRVDRAVVVKETPQFSEEELTDIDKQLLSLEVSTGVSEEATTENVQPSTETPESQDEYQLEEVDWSYESLGQNFGVPELTVDELDPEFQQWKEGFAKYLGHSWEDYKAARNELAQARKLRAELERAKHERNLEKQANFIKRSWGVDDAEYHRRMQKVVEVFSKLDDTTKAILDRDPTGALKLWRDIEMSEKLSEKTKQPQVPQYEKSKSTVMSNADSKKPMFTGSQIRNMPENKKAALWGKIIMATQQGLVDWSS